jgi:hypothetical protein
MRLAAAVELQLDPGKIERQLLEGDRGARALNHGDDLGALGDALNRRRERRPVVANASTHVELPPCLPASSRVG